MIRRAVWALVSPLQAESANAWREDVCAQLSPLLNADAVTFSLRWGDRVSLHSVGIEDDVLRAYADEYHVLDDGLNVRRPELGLEVWSRAMLWPEGRLESSPYFHDFAVPSRLFDAVGMTVEAAEPDQLATISAHRRRRGAGPFGARELKLLEMLLPTFKAGIGTLMRQNTHRQRMTRALD